MDLEKKYTTSEGIKYNILQMVKMEPEWAANKIQAVERVIKKIRTQVNQSKTMLRGGLKDFSGFPKEDFRQSMINYWMSNGFETELQALKCYGGRSFDVLCERMTPTVLMNFKYDIGETKTCFEIIDNNFVIPVDAIDIYKENK